MKPRMKPIFALALLALATLNLPRGSAYAQGTTFSYQGRLNGAGTPAEGIYDLQFTVYDAGTNGNLAAGPLTNAAVAISNGLFTIALDFGPGVFDGSARWLDIGVRTNGGGVFATLAPRQPVLPIPYAILANSASNLLGKLPSAQLSGTIPATNLTGTMPLAQLPGLVVTNNATAVILNGTFSGNGAGLTGVPGSLMWQNVTGTSQQAQPNTGYLANNAAPVTITLPPAPGLGDIVRVSGIGEGGWKIAQNTGQAIQAAQFGAVTTTNWNNLTNWTQTTAPNAFWRSVAASTDGAKLAAVWGQYAVQGHSAGGLYTSTDYGATWTQSNVPNTNFSSIASSADGSKLAAVCGGNPISYFQGGIYTSTNAGATWNQTGAPISSWTSIASSADGNKLAAVSYSGRIYTSTNSGLTWSNCSVGNYWTSIASSADGTKLAAASAYTQDWIMTSTNSGLNWVKATIPTHMWDCIASSADGAKLAAGGYPYIYTSTNSGVAWNQTTATNTAEWLSIASSADGTRLAAAVYYNGVTNQWGAIYTSTNSGATWNQTGATNTEEWVSIASSADGTRLAAVNYYGGIWTAQATIQTTTTPGPAGYLAGGQHSAIELQYIGNGLWLPLSHERDISAF
jgi:hypothetical protein